jgi:Fe-S cluster assembly protein SufD
MTALPTRKLEAWRYTDLRGLSTSEFAEGLAYSGMIGLPALEAPRAVFLNGVLSAAQSTPTDFSRDFAGASGTQPSAIEEINAAGTRDGLTLEIPAGTDAGALALISLASQGVAFHPRHRIVLGEGAALTLVEVSKGSGSYWHNEVVEISLGRGSTLHHIRLQDEGQDAYALNTIRVTVEESASYQHFSAIFGARLSRTEISVTLTGKAAQAQLNGVSLLHEAQLGDFTFVMRHQAPECTSRQTVRAVLDGSARGVFQGRIEVARQAQKTDGYQMSRALLLSPDAEMDIKPELEIFADDVKCSHGATIGSLDEEQVFYLRSRGIDEAQARSMLIRAFLTEALEPVTHDEARNLLEAAITSWWQQA